MMLKQKTVYWWLIFLMLLSACGHRSLDLSKDKSMWGFIDTVARRLALADQVALVKWDKGQAVEDREREQSLLSKGVAEAERYGLIPAQIEQWLRDQIEANKLVQYALLAQWRRTGIVPTQARADLMNEIRPQLERLQNSLLQQWVQTQIWRAQTHCPVLLAHLTSAYIKQQRIDVLHAVALDRALANVCQSQ